MSEPVSSERHGQIALIWVDHPPVNALSHAVRQGLVDAIAAIEADAAVLGFVIACRGRTFMAGADVREFGRPVEAPTLPDVVAAIDRAAKPSVAALFGSALGGGLEVALACNARLASRDAQLGLPEVTLGVIPGAWGTQLLPRLVGFERAIDMITTGKPISAVEAQAAGLVDAVVDGAVAAEATGWLATAIGQAAVPMKPSGRSAAADAALLISAARPRVERAARGQRAPLVALDAIAAAGGPLEAGTAVERSLFLQQRETLEAKALRRLFFGEREAGRLPELKDVQPRSVRHVGVVGAGTMGAGIAFAVLAVDLSVTVLETTPESVERGRDRLAGMFRDAVASGRVTEAAAAARSARLTVTSDVSALAPVDLVIEAVFEDLDVKQDLFRRLDQVVRPDAVLATNTSYLDVDAILDVLKDPSRGLGLHFFSPAHIMRLLEVVRGAATAPDVLATGLAFGKAVKKVPVVVGNAEGFVGNRILTAFRKQAEFLVEDGALPWDVDAAMVAFGFPMGPFAVSDMAGLDIAWANRKRQALSRDPAARYVTVADELCEQGRFGRKTGAGWYRYAEGARHGEPDPAVTQMIEAASRAKGITRRAFDAETIQRRVLAAMINEGGHALDQGVAGSALDVDLVMTLGYGFPRHKGGPMLYAEETGLSAIAADIRTIVAENGAGWRVADRFATAS
jgi:3-hydroxyacyl-CoA dehydrogenase